VSKLLLNEIEKYLNKLVKNISDGVYQGSHCLHQEEKQMREYVCRCVNIFVGLFESGKMWYQAKDQLKIFNVMSYMLQYRKDERTWKN
jgi:hypothetical protein